MKKQIHVSGLLVALLLVVSQVFSVPFKINPVHALSGSGTGTEQDPYQIATCEDLQSVNDDLTAHYVLTQNIDCSDSVNWNGGNGFVPIGDTFSEAGPFEGYFNGQGYTINSLYMNWQNRPSVGLFDAFVGGEIKNFSINGTVIGSNYTGGVVGIMFVAGTLTNVKSELDVTGQAIEDYQLGLPIAATGGVVGMVFGQSTDYTPTVTRVSSTGNISASGAYGFVNSVAGLVGLMLDNGELSNSYSTANVGSTEAGQIAAGGAVGMALTYQEGDGVPNINNSYSAGSVLIQDTNLGGGFIGGVMGGTVSNSFTAAPITVADGASADFGAFVGASFDDNSLSNNFLDVDRTYANTCIGGGTGDGVGCTGVNYGDGTGGPDYFFGNNTNPPLDQWDFTCAWQTQTDDYPILRAYDANCGATPEDSGSGGSNSSDSIKHITKKSTSTKLQSSITQIFADYTLPETTAINLSKMNDYLSGSGQQLGNLKVGQVIKFDIVRNGKTEHHTITFKKIGYSSITITVASKPFDVTLNLNQTKTISIDGQKVMQVSLTTLSDGSATMFFKRVPSAEELAAKKAASLSATNEASKLTDASTQHKKTSDQSIILAILGLILLASAAIFAARHKKNPVE